jgi:hypothetical protein
MRDRMARPAQRLLGWVSVRFDGDFGRSDAAVLIPLS